jgi:hypothetical protein
MKKLIAVPVVAVIAAAGAASAAGFAGGVSARALQVGQTSDLECATSAEIIEWGYNDHLATPDVVNARVQLNGADCSGMAIHVVALNPDGTATDGPAGNFRASGRIPAQAAGTQTVRVNFNQPVPAEQLKSVRISIDGGYTNLAEGSIG